MPKLLSEDQVRMMERDGYVAPIPVFSPERAAGYRAALERYEASVADRPREEVLFTLSRFKPHLLFTWLDEICNDPTLLDAIEDLIGPDILVYSTAFFTKNARDGAYVPWHQDSIYADFEGGRHVRAWVAFTDSNEANGCMRVIRGSQRLRLRHVETPDDAHNILFRKESIAEQVDESLAVDLVLRPGEMSVHDYSVVHGSNANASDDRRIGFAIAFVTPTTRPRSRRDTAMLVRGREPTGWWDLEPRPKADLDADAVEAHRRAMAQRTAHFFREVAEIGVSG
ncbi:MAG: phytanoyl-CoA dioxygenase family protein [Ectothiorhodospiraceae bacterium]|nr:phytanoyl-CoA dioxygenase family protein [Chromatiales bacterium]MCP5154897.1 phytanoyl-CoA dioxygenase family protein [Ectothiorhodospiraceae bacterium]